MHNSSFCNCTNSLSHTPSKSTQGVRLEQNKNPL